jgi:formamidopyrimidine-DNA glycosylase
MPELPEVETTRCGIAPALVGHIIRQVVVRERGLRWPVPHNIENRLRDQRVLQLTRRAKYLLLETTGGTALIHLGMSGSMRIAAADEPLEKHDHFEIFSSSGDIVRFNDPRRFGSLLWAGAMPAKHALLVGLGPEPFSDDFNGTYLYKTGIGRVVAIKQHIMNSKVVAGVGNIYANEALFRAGIHPARAAGRIALPRMEALATEIRAVQRDAIRQGGTTLRDYRGGDGKPGYFRQQLLVYERDGDACKCCGTPIRRTTQGQRATYYCHSCQT